MRLLLLVVFLVAILAMLGTVQVHLQLQQQDTRLRYLEEKYLENSCTYTLQYLHEQYEGGHFY